MCFAHERARFYWPVKSSELAALSEHAGKSSQGESCRTVMLLADQYERRRALQAPLLAPAAPPALAPLRLPALLPNLPSAWLGFPAWRVPANQLVPCPDSGQDCNLGCLLAAGRRRRQLAHPCTACSSAQRGRGVPDSKHTPTKPPSAFASCQDAVWDCGAAPLLPRLGAPLHPGACRPKTLVPVARGCCGTQMQLVGTLMLPRVSDGQTGIHTRLAGSAV